MPIMRVGMYSNLGKIVKKILSDRAHECPCGGFMIDGDYNVAVNTHRVGMEHPFEPVEMIHLHHISVMRVLSITAGKPRPIERGSSLTLSTDPDYSSGGIDQW